MSSSISDLPFRIDELLSLRIQRDGNNGTARVRVKRLQQPWTLSCGMVVELVSSTLSLPNQNSQMFLKLYDRRFAEQLRRDRGVPTWSEQAETSYIKFVESGYAGEFLDSLREDEDYDDKDDSPETSMAKQEAFLFYECSNMYNAETMVYNALRAYQGLIVPKFICTVTLDPTSNASTPGVAENLDLLQIQGILIEYISGVKFAELDRHFPESSWQGLVDQAVQIVHTLGDNFVINEDVRPDNILVSTNNNSSSNEHRVVMIDFGQSRLREPEETDQEWGRAKWSQDEEGAVALVMQNRLRKKGFALRYVPSMRYLEWAPGEDD